MYDLISREAAIKSIKLWRGMLSVETAVAEISAIPAMDAVTVVHGRWERTRHWWQGGSTWKRCSECKVLNCGESKFCPNCGVRMDLPKGEEARDDG